MTRRRKAAWLLLAVVAGTVASLSGCSNLGYYWQSANGHLDLMRSARPVPQWLADPATSAALRDKLALTQRMRRFAVTELGLPDNASYTEYADLHRGAAVWNVVAAPPYSLKLKTWCFPVAGCVGYRGYYRDADALAEAEVQRAEGFEAGVYPVPAYSTLGWLNWAGGDPLLSTFIGYPEGELARLMFHELAHQVLYVPGDTAFNESYATAVERIGGARWLATEASEAARSEYAQFDQRRQQFRQLTLETRQQLEAIYDASDAMDASPAGDRDRQALDARKKAALDDFRARYAALRAGWSGPQQGAYDRWVARANNAMFGAQAVYDDLVPAFEALFEREGRDWRRFHAAAAKLAALPRNEREEALKNMTQQNGKPGV
ncbi:aminopeptidase [Variovorax sp. dw_954]|uniref:aminopeptidase n=1 Tax=Variovorax sp. dw_954 TaxID=2720078 RepID=UPI001BD27FD7|nr:aminopeptidase [Variovorax sp. dw_954]